MPLVTIVVHPRGLHPIMQVRAYHLHVEDGMSLDKARDEVHNLQGNAPGKTCVHSAANGKDNKNTRNRPIAIFAVGRTADAIPAEPRTPASQR